MTFSLGITVGACLAVILTVTDLAADFGRARARVLQGEAARYLKAVNTWSVFGIATHAISISANLLYMHLGVNHTQAVPLTLVLMGIASCLNCFILIRYLSGIPNIKQIVTVTRRSSILIGKFLIGCGIVLIGYMLLGCCLFGTYCITFRTWNEGARALIAVVHGDSIQDMFDNAAVRPDISTYFGFLYWVVWVFFSLTIMFNISISIFEHVLKDQLNERRDTRDE
jgi:hypothetical protein